MKGPDQLIPVSFVTQDQGKADGRPYQTFETVGQVPSFWVFAVIFKAKGLCKWGLETDSKASGGLNGRTLR